MDQRQGLASRDRNQRTCTDSPCCLLFGVAIAAFAFLGVYAVQHRNTDVLDRIQSGRDFKHRRCGVDAGVEDFKFVYFTFKVNHTPVQVSSWSAELRSQLKPVCTNKCPQADPDISNMSVPSRSSDKVCPTDMYPDWCTWYGAQTLAVARYCIDINAFTSTAPNAAWLQDLKASAWHILIAFPVAVVVGFVFLFVVQNCGVVFVWAFLFVTAAIPIGVGWWVHTETQKSSSLPVHKLDPKQLKILEFALYALGGLILLFAFIFCRTVRGVARVIEATAKFLKDVPSQMLQPLVFAALYLIVIVAWLAVFICFTSMFVEEGKEQQCLEIGNVFCLEWNTTNIAYGIVFLLLMLYWLSNFLHALSHFGTSLAVITWYEDSSTDELAGTCCDFKRTLKSIGTGLGKNVGSLAFGSLVMSAAKTVKLLLWWVTKENESQSNNQCMKCVFRVMTCLAECLERFINFVTEHAYVEVALCSTTFCKSCTEGLARAVRHPGMFTVVGYSVFVLRILGIIIVTASSTYVVFLSLVFATPEGLQSKATPTPLIAAALCGGTVAELMLHPMTVTARAALHCFCKAKEDAEHYGRPPIRTPQHEAMAQLEETTRASTPESRRCCC